MKLLDEPTEVNDKPGAPDLVVDDGEIEFGEHFDRGMNRRILTLIYP